MISLVLTCIGPDRPGLVESLSNTVAAHGANWEESRMSRLAGQFVGILSIRVPNLRADELIRALGSIEDARITIQKSEEGAVTSSQQWQACQLSFSGMDRPGILRDMSKLLVHYSVDFGDLQTTCIRNPEKSDMQFEAKATLHIPTSLDVDEIQTALEAISDDVSVELKQF